MAFTPLLPPVSKRPRMVSRQASQLTDILNILRQNFQLSTLLLIGAALQTMLTLIIPSYYACLPVFAVLLGRLTYTLAITYGILANPYLEGSIPERASALVPDTDGKFGDSGAAEPVVCFHLGAKMNHPLGYFSANAKALADYFEDMARDLDANKAHNGFLGGSNFSRTDDRGAIEITFISYWRSIEAIHNFAYGPIHRAGWEWWNKLPKKDLRHIGINHEIFAAAPHQWEAIYLNHQPTLLGAATYLQKGNKENGGQVDDVWVGSLMDATKGKLKSSAGRLGWQPDHLYEKQNYTPIDDYGNA